MSVDVRRQCAICAWREDCAKKHATREASLHCPDFCRDRALGDEDPSPGAAERHKQVEDVFQEKGPTAERRGHRK